MDYSGRFIDAALTVQSGKGVEFGGNQVARLPNSVDATRVVFKQVGWRRGRIDGGREGWGGRRGGRNRKKGVGGRPGKDRCGREGTGRCTPFSCPFIQMTWVPNELEDYSLILLEFLDRLSEPRGWLIKLWECLLPGGIVVITSDFGKWDRARLEGHIGKR